MVQWKKRHGGTGYCGTPSEHQHDHAMEEGCDVTDNALRKFADTAAEDDLREFIRRLSNVDVTGVSDGRETRWMYDADDIRAALSGHV